MRSERLIAIAGTSKPNAIAPGIPADIAHPSLTPAMTIPAFTMPDGLFLTELVAVTCRDADGHPIDGGIFGVTPEMEVVSISLVDVPHGIDTGKDPAWAAFGLIMSAGPLNVQDVNGTHELKWSIIDFKEGGRRDERNHSTPARSSVHEAFASDRAAATAVG